MAQIETRVLKVGDNDLVLQDAAIRASMATEYNASSPYAVGDMVLHDGQLYECSTAIATAEAWTAAHWTAVVVGDELSSLKEEYTQILDSAYVTDTASGSIASFPDGADGVPVKSLKVNIEPLQSGSGDPSPDNVRPISGHTQAVVTRTGKNLFDGVMEDGTIDGNGNNAYQANRYRSKNYISVKPNQRYVFSKNGAKQTVNWRLYDINKTFMSGINIGSNPFTVPDGCYYLRFFADDVINVTSGLQLELGETPTAYESPNIQTVTIDLDGTRYGGTLDVGTGVLTVDRAFIASYNGETLPSTWISDRDVYAAGTTPTTGAQVCYELAEPLTVQLTANEISTVLGQNNIWADTGDVEVEYRADTKLYIQKVMSS